MRASNHVQLFTIHGDLASASFLPWIARHCHRLGLTCQQVEAGAEKAVFKIGGQPDLIDALEVGCLLGPFDVWVETIQRSPTVFHD